MFPIVLAGVFIAFCLFYYMEQKRRIRREQSRQDKKEKFERLTETLKKQKVRGNSN